VEGTKLKNIVIIILLLLNGFLLFLVGGRWFEDSHSHELARSSAIQVIRDSAVALEETVVPREMTLHPMQAERSLTHENSLASGLLGGEMTVEALGGEVYRYASGRGWIQFHSSGEFIAEFEPGAFQCAGEAARHAAGVLSMLDFDAQVLEDNGIPGECRFAPGCTYAKSIPNTVCFGPVFEGDHDCAHMDNEGQSLEHYILSAELYAQYLAGESA